MDRVEIEFSQVIETILEIGQKLEYQTLVNLSDLDPAELDQITSIWNTIPDHRRLELMREVAQLGKDDTVLSFLELGKFALRDDLPEIRTLALEIVDLYEDRSSIPLIKKMLDQDENFEVRAAAAASLGKYIYLGELGKIDRNTYSQIQEHLFDAVRQAPTEDIRRKALESLGYSSGEAIEVEINQAAKSNDKKWQISALRAMGRSADEQWADHVLSMLDHEVSDVKTEAILASGELEIHKSVDKLSKLLFELNDDIQLQACIRALSQIGGENAKDALERMYSECDDEEQQELIEQAHQSLTFYEGFMDFPIFDLPEDDPEQFIIDEFDP